MEEQRLVRINELYHKSQKEGLSEEEKAEQARLRSEYVAAIRQNLRGTLNNVSLINPDGSITKASDLQKKKQDGLKED